LFKKGGMPFQTILIILVLISITIAAFILVPLLKGGEEASERAACKTSVDIGTKSKIGTGWSWMNNLNCKTQHHEIDELNEEKIYEEIVNEMYDCWYQFGEGKRDFLHNWDLGKGDNWCFICSRLDFSEDVQDKYSKLEGLDEYMKTNLLPFSNEDQTFFEYMYGDFSDEIDKYNLDMDINTSESQYILFFLDKRNVAKDQWKAIGGVLAGGVLCITGIFFSPFSLGSTALIGCGIAGSAIGTAFAILHKSGFVSGLYFGESTSTIERCGQ